MHMHVRAVVTLEVRNPCLGHEDRSLDITYKQHGPNFASFPLVNSRTDFLLQNTFK